MGDITTHFSWSELDPRNEADYQTRLNLARVATFLESVRMALGSKPLIVTSGYRSLEYNRKVGGSKTSPHLTGEGVDIKANHVTPYRAYKILSNVELPPFDQIIYYPLDGHIHIGIGPRLRREHRIRVAETYPRITEALARLLPGSGSGTSAILLFVFVAAIALILTEK